MLAPVWAILLALAACQDPNRIDEAGRAHLVQSAQTHLQDMRRAEATIRQLNDPKTRIGRARIRAAVHERKGAELMLRTATSIAAREAARNNR